MCIGSDKRIPRSSSSSSKNFTDTERFFCFPFFPSFPLLLREPRLRYTIIVPIYVWERPPSSSTNSKRTKTRRRQYSDPLPPRLSPSPSRTYPLSSDVYSYRRLYLPLHHFHFSSPGCSDSRSFSFKFCKEIEILQFLSVRCLALRSPRASQNYRSKRIAYRHL